MPAAKGHAVGASLEPLIFAIRGHRVVLDADLARRYGVTTKRLNEAMKRNRRRFPEDFAFQLTADELADLRSQVAAFRQRASELPREQENWSQFATSSSRHRGAAYRPRAFTEHGALMAASILRSELAEQMSSYVIRAFVRLPRKPLPPLLRYPLGRVDPWATSAARRTRMPRFQSSGSRGPSF